MVVGVVGKPFGVRGEVYVRPDPDLDHDFAPGTTYETVTGPLVVAWTHVHGTRRLLRFEGVEDRDGAEALRGTALRLPRSDVPLEDDAFWTDEVLGREVTDEAGEVLGVLEAVADGTAHDYFVIARPDGGEVLVPAVAELVRVEADRIVVTVVPGLLDL